MTDSVVLPGVGGGMKSMNETYWGELKKKDYLSFYFWIYTQFFGGAEGKKKPHK